MRTKAVNIILVLLILVVSCKEDSNYEQIVGSVGNGAYLRVLDVQSVELNPNTPNATVFNLAMEAVISVNASQLVSVDVYATYISDHKTEIDEKVMIGSISIEQFETSIESSLPRYNYELNLTDILGVASLHSYDELRRGDIIRLELVTNLSNGDTFSVVNSGLGVKGQPFYNSPFMYDIGVTCEPEDKSYALGLYDLEVDHEMIHCPFFPSSGCDHFEDRKVNIRVGNNSHERVFTSTYFGNELDFYFDLECGKVIVPYRANGLKCGELNSIWAMDDDTVNMIDFSNDDSLTFSFVSDFEDACSGRRLISFTLTRE